MNSTFTFYRQNLESMDRQKKKRRRSSSRCEEEILPKLVKVSAEPLVPLRGHAQPNTQPHTAEELSNNAEKSIIDELANKNDPSQFLYMCIKTAIKKKMNKLIEKLVFYKEFNPKFTDQKGSTVLHHAAAHDNQEAFKILLSSGKFDLKLNGVSVLLSAASGKSCNEDLRRS